MLTEFRRLAARIAALFRSRSAESDLSREINAHLQLLEDTYIASGMSPADARAAAKRAFGGIEQAKERQRDERSFRWLSGWPMDVKLGARLLIKSPGITVVAVIALAVAIGAGATYFEFFNDFFRPALTFAGGDRLVGVTTFDVANNTVHPHTSAEFLRWRQQLRTIEDLGAGRALDENLTTEDGRVEPVRGAEVTASTFRLLPAIPVLGRPLLEDDEQPGAPPVAVIGYDLWRERFDGDTTVVGKTLTLGTTPHTIVGVMPQGFGFPVNHMLWRPLRLESAAPGRTGGPMLRVFGRLATGVDLRAAQAELAVVVMSARDAAANQQLRTTVKPYVESLWSAPNLRWQFRLLYSFNLFFIGLLGICGMNVATLVFARTAAREGEITVRTALGASRGRIVSQLVIESALLAALAAIVGLAGASALLRLVRDIWVKAQGESMPFWWNDQLGIETYLYTGVLVVLAALLIGGVPALKATGAVLQGRLKQAGGSGSTMRFGRMWTGVIVSQVAITLVFLLTTISLGWETITTKGRFNAVAFAQNKYLTARLSVPGDVPPERVKTAVAEIRRRLDGQPGVAGVTYATRLPGLGQEEFWVELTDKAIQQEAFAKSADDVLWVRSARVAENFFDTFGIDVVAGRGFAQSDVESGRPVAIVDESFVRLVLGGRTAIGQLVREPAKNANGEPGPWLEIVGVVQDVSTRPDKRTDDAMLYRPYTFGSAAPMRIIVHAPAGAAALDTPLRRAAAAADPALRLTDVLPMDHVPDVEIATMSFFAAGFGAIGAVALLLSTAGIYSLISFTLGRRTREIGIRMALGAPPRRIITGILSKSFIQIGAGLVIGAIPGLVILDLTAEEATNGSSLPGAIAITLVAVVFVLSVAAVACLVPLRRALRIDPTNALRTDA